MNGTQPTSRRFSAQQATSPMSVSSGSGVSMPVQTKLEFAKEYDAFYIRDDQGQKIQIKKDKMILRLGVAEAKFIWDKLVKFKQQPWNAWQDVLSFKQVQHKIGEEDMLKIWYMGDVCYPDKPVETKEDDIVAQISTATFDESLPLPGHDDDDNDDSHGNSTAQIKLVSDATSALEPNHAADNADDVIAIVDGKLVVPTSVFSCSSTTTVDMTLPVTSLASSTVLEQASAESVSVDISEPDTGRESPELSLPKVDLDAFLDKHIQDDEVDGKHASSPVPVPVSRLVLGSDKSEKEDSLISGKDEKNEQDETIIVKSSLDQETDKTTESDLDKARHFWAQSNCKLVKEIDWTNAGEFGNYVLMPYCKGPEEFETRIAKARAKENKKEQATANDSMAHLQPLFAVARLVQIARDETELVNGQMELQWMTDVQNDDKDYTEQNWDKCEFIPYHAYPPFSANLKKTPNAAYLWTKTLPANASEWSSVERLVLDKFYKADADGDYVSALAERGKRFRPIQLAEPWAFVNTIAVEDEDDDSDSSESPTQSGKRDKKTEKNKKTKTNEASKVDHIEQYIHEGVKCDMCNLKPIVGTRYNCTVCYNFDLCTTCEFKGKHPKSHPLVKMHVNDAIVAQSAASVALPVSTTPSKTAVAEVPIISRKRKGKPVSTRSRKDKKCKKKRVETDSDSEEDDQDSQRRVYKKHIINVDTESDTEREDDDDDLEIKPSVSDKKDLDKGKRVDFGFTATRTFAVSPLGTNAKTSSTKIKPIAKPSRYSGAFSESEDDAKDDSDDDDESGKDVPDNADASDVDRHFYMPFAKCKCAKQFGPPKDGLGHGPFDTRLVEFINACIELGPGYKQPATRLFEAWQNFKSKYIIHHHDFFNVIHKTCCKIKEENTTYYLGLRLKSSRHPLQKKNRDKAPFTSSASKPFTKDLDKKLKTFTKSLKLNETTKSVPTQGVKRKAEENKAKDETKAEERKPKRIKLFKLATFYNTKPCPDESCDEYHLCAKCSKDKLTTSDDQHETPGLGLESGTLAQPASLASRLSLSRSTVAGSTTSTTTPSSLPLSSSLSCSSSSTLSSSSVLIEENKTDSKTELKQQHQHSDGAASNLDRNTTMIFVPHSVEDSRMILEAMPCISKSQMSNIASWKLASTRGFSTARGTIYNKLNCGNSWIYMDITILKSGIASFGWAGPTFEKVILEDGQGVGDGKSSWSIGGEPFAFYNGTKKHTIVKNVAWKTGDRCFCAVDLRTGDMEFKHIRGFVTTKLEPGFQLTPQEMALGLTPAITLNQGMVVQVLVSHQ